MKDQTMQVQVKKNDQLILSCDMDEISKQNKFIRSLVAEAYRSHDLCAEREDDEGCCFAAQVAVEDTDLQIRCSDDGVIMVWCDGEPLRCPTQEDMDTLPIGDAMTDEEVDLLEDW